MAYFAVQFVIRLMLSPNLEVDDAEMVGQVGWAWGYANSHPPLYSWLVRICHDASGDWVLATALPKYGLLAAGYLFVYAAVRRASGSAVTAALSVAALILIPQVAWKTQAKLSHSILGFAATAATLHAAGLVLRSGRWRDFAWLGVAVTAGVLSKYNYLFVLAGLLVAIGALPQARRAFLRPRGLLAVALVLLLTVPHLLWLRSHVGAATDRLYMLRQPQDALPHGGALPLDGLLSLLIALAVSIAPPLLAWLVAGKLLDRAGQGGGRTLKENWAAYRTAFSFRSFPRKREPRFFGLPSETVTPLRPEEEKTWAPARAGVSGLLHAHLTRGADAATLRRLALVVFAASIAGFALAALFGGFHKVHERYLLALVPAFAVWLPLAWPLDGRRRAAGALLAVGALVALGATIARPVLAHTTDNRLAWPYAQFAGQLLPPVPQAAAVVAERPENSANLAIHLPGAPVFDEATHPSVVLAAADDAAGIDGIEQGLARDYAAGPRVILCGRLMNAVRKRVCLTTEVMALRSGGPHFPSAMGSANPGSNNH